MSDYLADTPAEIHSKCPGCWPAEDPGTFVTHWCDAHAPSRRGADDERVVTQEYLQGSAEAGGIDNRRWCDAIHRGR